MFRPNRPLISRVTIPLRFGTNHKERKSPRLYSVFCSSGSIR